jgi:hypothetical protein
MLTPVTFFMTSFISPCASDGQQNVRCLRVVSQVVYGADKQSWANVRSALRKGEAKDGTVTLVLERRLPRDTAAAPISSTTTTSRSGSS